MKNVHVLPTDKPSRFYYHSELKQFVLTHKTILRKVVKNQHIYITSDEEIKEGDAYITKNGEICKSHNGSKILLFKTDKKIILTTDQDLIKNGVQAIPDEFLEWFVKNPSCKEVEIINWVGGMYPCKYKIIIPKEEPKQERKDCICKEHDFDVMKGLCKVCGNSIIHLGKRIEVSKQETLEEATRKYLKNCKEAIHDNIMFIQGSNFGAKWQQERMYSEEEVIKLLQIFAPHIRYHYKELADRWTDVVSEWFEKFKKK